MEKNNRFSKNMSFKSDAELEAIIENKDKYTEEALQAVVWELEKRELRKEGEIVIKQPIFEEIEKVELTHSNRENAFDEFEVPTLYSKKTIQGFTIFFSTIFGAVLLMSNLKTMNKSKESLYVLLFGIGYTILTYIIIFSVGANFVVTLILNLIGYAILTEYLWNNYLGKDLSYTKKGITKPLVISLLILGFIIFLQFLPMILGEPME
ncbi:hypothetical protein [Polaribacter porphyrae]|uniref:Uncharacterized protein n=1 Tax=Polaribacter porphyrae TaxID=1137780 RepID=A0A2S7WRL3_9FLAO|nr:hypothetical protein [Polaribacter porphyrae]PQJ80243.1 hypothetical protein BTO18_14120 [Polaribacter porphyrae]